MEDLESKSKSNENLVCDSLTKFFELWRGRQAATFHLECRNGEASFHFSAFLGHPDKAGRKVSNKMSPSKIRRNKARAEAHAAAKNNPDKDLISASSHESDNTNQISESGNPVQNAQSQNDSFNKENGGPSLELNFLGDSLLPKKQHKECNINLEEVVSSLIQSAVSTASFIMKLLQRHFIHIMVNMF